MRKINVLIWLFSIVFCFMMQMQIASASLDKFTTANDYNVDFERVYSGVDKEIFMITINYTGLKTSIVPLNNYLVEANANNEIMFYRLENKQMSYTKFKSCKIDIDIRYPNGTKIKESVNAEDQICGDETIYYYVEVETPIYQIDLSKDKNIKVKAIAKKSGMTSYGTMHLTIDGNDFFDKTHSSWWNTSFYQRYNLTIISNPKNFVNFNISNTTCYNSRNTTRLTLNNTAYPFEWKQSKNGITTDWIEFIYNGSTQGDYVLYCNGTGLVSGTWGNSTITSYKNNFDDNTIDSDMENQTSTGYYVEQSGIFNISAKGIDNTQISMNFTKAVMDRTNQEYWITFSIKQAGNVAGMMDMIGLAKVSSPYASQKYLSIGQYGGGAQPNRFHVVMPNYATIYNNFGYYGNSVANVTIHLNKTSGFEFWSLATQASPANYTGGTDSESFTKGSLAIWSYGGTAVAWSEIDNLYVSLYEVNFSSVHGSVAVSAEEKQTDTPYLSVTMQSPVNASIYQYTNITLNYTLKANNPVTCKYEFDGGTNISLSGCKNSTFIADDSGYSNHKLILFVFDSMNNILNSTIAYFRVKLINPKITPINPVNLATYNNPNISITFNTIASVRDKCWYYYNNTNINLPNCNNGSLILLGGGWYNITMFINDTDGITNSSDVILFYYNENITSSPLITFYENSTLLETGGFTTTLDLNTVSGVFLLITLIIIWLAMIIISEITRVPAYGLIGNGVFFVLAMIVMIKVSVWIGITMLLFAVAYAIGKLMQL